MSLFGNTKVTGRIIPLSALNTRVSTDFARGVDCTQRWKIRGFSQGL